MAILNAEIRMEKATNAEDTETKTLHPTASHIKATKRMTTHTLSISKAEDRSHAQQLQSGKPFTMRQGDAT